MFQQKEIEQMRTGKDQKVLYQKISKVLRKRLQTNGITDDYQKDYVIMKEFNSFVQNCLKPTPEQNEEAQFPVPNKFLIKLQQFELEMWAPVKNGRTTVIYSLKQRSQLKVSAAQSALDTFVDLAQRSKYRHLFCPFEIEIIRDNVIKIKVTQENPFVSIGRGQPIQLSSLISDLCRGSMELMKREKCWRMLTANSITVDCGLKINTVQGYLELKSAINGNNVSQSYGQYLSKLIEYIVEECVKDGKVIINESQKVDYEHFLMLLKVAKNVNEKENNGEFQLEVILRGHPLFLNGGEKRAMIHDSSNFFEYLRGKEIKQHYPDLSYRLEGIAKTLNSWVNYNAFLQNIHNNDSKAIYNWVHPELEGLVKDFNDVNFKNFKNQEKEKYKGGSDKEKDLLYGALYKEIYFKDHLRFVRNLVFHPNPYKEAIQAIFKSSHLNPDDLLVKIEKRYPRLLTFIYDFNRIQRNFFEQLRKGRNININEFTFTPRRDSKVGTYLKRTLQNFFQFERREYWPYLRSYENGGAMYNESEEAVKRFKSVSNLLFDAKKRLQQKLNIISQSTSLEIDSIGVLRKDKILNSKKLIQFGEFVMKNFFQGQKSVLEIYLRLEYHLTFGKKIEQQQVLEICSETHALWPVYSALTDINKRQSTLLGAIKCPDYFKSYCTDGYCSFMHSSACADVIKHKNCQSTDRCKDLFHPQPQLCWKDPCEDEKCKRHLPICSNYYYGKCNPWNCLSKSKGYHPPVGICTEEIKKLGSCPIREICKYYHPHPDEVPKPPSVNSSPTKPRI